MVPMVGVGRLCPLPLSSLSHFAGQLLGVGVSPIYLSATIYTTRQMGWGFWGEGFSSTDYQELPWPSPPLGRLIWLQRRAAAGGEVSESPRGSARA